MKKKVIYISVSILILLAVILTINSAPKEKIYLNKDNIEANKSLAIYIEQENGSYNKTTTFPGKEDGYTLNTSKSVCNGSTNISWDKESWGIELSNIDREETKCYLYFDIYVEPSDQTLAKLGITGVKDTTPAFGTAATKAENADTNNGIFRTDDGMYGGKSVYWRGAATTNHVIFANKCWRIVRINGDGSIRLIYNGAVQSGNTCLGNGANTSTTAVTSQTYSKGGVYNNSAYVGYTYTVSKQRPEGTPEESNLKTQTDTWYNNNIGNNAAYKDKVADGKFCNDRNTKNNEEWRATGTGFQYAAYARLVDAKTPTLGCDTEDVYTLKAGAITADEVAFAGGVYGTGNSSYYLYNNTYYWTMSPCDWNSPNARVFCVNTYGGLDGYSVSYTAPGVRPVINLRSDVTFNSGSDGTQNNPYVVS